MFTIAHPVLKAFYLRKTLKLLAFFLRSSVDPNRSEKWQDQLRYSPDSGRT